MSPIASEMAISQHLSAPTSLQDNLRVADKPPPIWHPVKLTSNRRFWRHWTQLCKIDILAVGFVAGGTVTKELEDLLTEDDERDDAVDDEGGVSISYEIRSEERRVERE